MARLRWFGILALVASAGSLAALLCGCGGSGPGEGVLRILVTNDYGTGAEGIDVLVEALLANPNNILVISAPDGDRSGTGDQTGPSQQCGDLTVTPAATLSGRAATAINGCPADAVNYALDELYPADQPPHVVVSGSNGGQNVGELVARQFSGTVGAAKTAARRGIPALAVSQGRPAQGGVYDYPAGVDSALAWLADNRRLLQTRSVVPSDVDNINAPSCSEGTIRGTIVGLPLAEDATGAFEFQDCTSTLEDPADDIEALLNGFITVTKVPLD